MEETDKELIAEATTLHESLYVTECYGLNDVRRYNEVIEELRKRGYDLTNESGIKITKGDE